MAKKSMKVPYGHVLARHADTGASCTVDGITYEASEDGIVVPYSAVEALWPHGFYPDGENVEQEPAPEADAAAEPAEAPATE